MGFVSGPVFLCSATSYTRCVGGDQYLSSVTPCRHHIELLCLWKWTLPPTTKPAKAAVHQISIHSQTSIPSCQVIMYYGLRKSCKACNVEEKHFCSVFLSFRQIILICWINSPIFYAFVSLELGIVIKPDIAAKEFIFCGFWYTSIKGSFYIDWYVFTCYSDSGKYIVIGCFSVGKFIYYICFLD